MPIIVLAGEEEFELYRYVKKLKGELVDPAWAAFNFVRQEISDLRDVIDAAASLPFGSGKKLVLLDRCDLFTKKKARAGDETGKTPAGPEKAAKRLIEDFDRALACVSPDTYLVFACPHNFDSSLKISKIASKYAEVKEFPKGNYWPGSKNVRLESWCRKEAKLHGATIDDAAISYLLESSEGNLRQAASEIEKAATFLLPGTHISLQAVATVSLHNSHVFLLLDLWAKKMHIDALTSLEELLSRQSGLPIIAALQTVLSKWLQLKMLAAREESRLPSGAGIQRRAVPVPELARTLAAELRLSPYVVEMDLKRIRTLTAGELAAKRVQLCRLDYLVKTGQIADHQALTLFVTTR